MSSNKPFPLNLAIATSCTYVCISVCLVDSALVIAMISKIDFGVILQFFEPMQF